MSSYGFKINIVWPSLCHRVFDLRLGKLFEVQPVSRDRREPVVGKAG